MEPDTSAAAEPWREVRRVVSTVSTNADAVAAAKAGEAAGLVIVASEQTSARGRLDRRWISAPGAGLTFSVLVRPGTPDSSWGWAPLLGGLAVAEAVEQVTGITTTLKWPNDVLVGSLKVAGLLAEHVPPDGLVLGVGLNTKATREQLPVATATSLLLAGAASEGLEEEPLLASVLDALARRLAHVHNDEPSPRAKQDYRDRCSSLGRDVCAILPGDGRIEGRAVDISDEGGLLIQSAEGVRHVFSGDVVHLR